jgi:membrane-bound metal-dependent hydrolase YbcI (DUF457 family)
MQKRTHLLLGILLFLMFNQVLGYPLAMGAFAAIGALLPDIDLRPRTAHRKVCHNLWFLAIVIIFGLNFGWFNWPIATALTLGFLSHMIGDSFTPHGVHWLWPLPVPHFKGSLRTGSAEEWAVALGMIVAIGFVAGVLHI